MKVTAKSTPPSHKAKTARVASLAGTASPSPTLSARRLSVCVQYAVSDEGLPSRAQVRRWLRACKPGAAQVTVRFVGRDEARTLNAAYRGKDYATNVLSFPYSLAPIVEGDLLVCAAVVQREAEEQGKGMEAHFAHLIVHGMLHLQGYDHNNDADATAMENREMDILARLGYPDPYHSEG